VTSRRASTFTESVIREMTRVAQQHGAINLAQGFPDFPMPAPMKDAACAAIHGDVNQYAVTWGSPALRLAVAEKYRRWYGLEVDPDREVTVTCGATEAMASAFLALVDPGDEVVILAPYYENYGPDAVLAGATPVYVPLLAPDWRIDEDALGAVPGGQQRFEQRPLGAGQVLEPVREDGSAVPGLELGLQPLQPHHLLVSF